MDPTAPNGAVLLTLNIGSSSVKFAVFSVVDPSLRLLDGHYEDRDSQLRWTVVGSNAQPVSHCQMTVELRDGDTWRESMLRTIFDLFRSNDMIVQAIVHRVVHGGGRFVGPTLIDGPTIEQLESYISWAPLHQPECLRAIRLTKQWYPDLPQIACFDTAFHHTIPAEAAQFAIPRWLSDRGIRRYGFHGLSFQSVWRKLAEVEPRVAMGRIVVAHLGGGSSLCGIAAGRSVATTMGLTPLDGIPMATRCGAIDPGVILHLLDVEKNVRRANLQIAVPRVWHAWRFQNFGRHARVVGQSRRFRTRGRAIIRLSSGAGNRGHLGRFARNRWTGVYRRDRRELA